MTPPTPPSIRVDTALRRFVAALDQLEAAMERRADGAHTVGNLQEELAVMQDDRARLAAELDGALSRYNALSLASDEAARRVDRASAAVRAILAADAARTGEPE